MNGLVVAPAWDTGTAEHPHDASGAFQPRARDFAKAHGLPPPALLDNHAVQHARELALVALVARTPGPLEALGVFCHGTRNWLQLGPTMSTIGDFARSLAANAVRDRRFTVALYACLTGEDVAELGKRPPVNTPGAGDGSLADGLRDGLLAAGLTDVRVFAHSTPGDAWDNHFVRIFDGSTTNGGEWLIAPGSPDWPAWNHAMHHSDLWARAPFMSRDEVLAELHGATA